MSPVTRKALWICDWLHDEIWLELKSKWVCGQEAASSPLFWCSELWWSKTFVPCWVTILLGKWNLELSTGQEDPTSPEAKFIQAFLYAVQMSCSIYAERNNPVYCCFPNPHTYIPPLKSFFLSEVCLYLKIPIISSNSTFSAFISQKQTSPLCLQSFIHVIKT